MRTFNPGRTVLNVRQQFLSSYAPVMILARCGRLIYMDGYFGNLQIISGIVSVVKKLYSS